MEMRKTFKHQFAGFLLLACFSIQLFASDPVSGLNLNLFSIWKIGISFVYLIDWFLLECMNSDLL